MRRFINFSLTTKQLTAFPSFAKTAMRKKLKKN